MDCINPDDHPPPGRRDAPPDDRLQRMMQYPAKPMLFRMTCGYFATNPASVISVLLSASSSSRNFSMSLPVRKIGFSACFSM